MSRYRFEDIVRYIHFNNNDIQMGRWDGTDETQAEPYAPVHAHETQKMGTKFYFTCRAHTAYCSRLDIYCGNANADEDSTNSPTKNLTLDECKAQAQAAKAASPKRVGEGAAAAKKRAAPGSPTSEPTIAKGFRSLFVSSDEEEEEGAVFEPQEISNDLDEQQERYQAAQLQGTPVPPTPVYPRGYYPDAGSGSPMFLEHLKAPRGLNHGRTSRGAYGRALVQVEPLFVNDIEAARCVLLAPHRIPLKEFTSLRKKPEDCGGLFPLWGYPREHHNPLSGRRPVLEMGFSKELYSSGVERTPRRLSALLWVELARSSHCDCPLNR
ncbi:ATP-binding cassette (ABC) Superfamily [Phytophthora palmivora]|uniref:ATP-binding cassette (ABC) Superfamily n=1 Tax=Phytophthora palmivora TaxID=4796 RepID=A0A2P4X431_9STRA|nr:ATP-binding cassette (ABC) Superfamily [Phytophthora palmivora]